MLIMEQRDNQQSDDRQARDPERQQQQGGALFGGQRPDDMSETLIDPTTDQSDRRYAREGQGAEQRTGQANKDERNQQRENPLDGE